MKTKLIFLIILILSVSISAQEKTTELKTVTSKGDTVRTESVIISHSEDITPRKHMIIVNPLKFLLFYNISYFTKIGDDLVIGGGIQTPTISGINGFGVNAELRYYPTGKNMRGFYLAPNIAYNLIEGDDTKITPFSFGGLIGWQWFPSDQFAMGLGIGIDYYTGDVKDEGDFSSFDGTCPTLRFDIGFAW